MSITGTQFKNQSVEYITKKLEKSMQSLGVSIQVKDYDYNEDNCYVGCPEIITIPPSEYVSLEFQFQGLQPIEIKILMNLSNEDKGSYLECEGRKYMIEEKDTISLMFAAASHNYSRWNGKVFPKGWSGLQIARFFNQVLWNGLARVELKYKPSN